MSSYQAFMEKNYSDFERINVMSFPGGKIQNKILPVERLKNVSGAQPVDTFMSMNPLQIKNNCIRRDKEHVSRLKWLYVDLDYYHGYYKGFTSQQILGILELDYFEKKIPVPTYVINSGRGMYLLWRVDEHIKAYPRWARMQKYLCEQLAEFGADHKVATDSSRVLRQIGSINSKSGTSVHIMQYQDVKYSLSNLMREYVTDPAPSDKMVTYARNIAQVLDIALPDMNNREEVKKYIRDNKEPANLFLQMQRVKDRKKQKKSKIHYMGTEYSLLLARIKDIETLLFRYRDKEGGYREYILFLYRYWQLCLLEDKEKSLEATLELNNRLKHPLGELEVKTATKSAEKYYEAGKIFRCTNTYVIDALEITAEEMENLSIFINPQERNRRKRIRNKNAYLGTLKKLGKLTAEQKIKRRREKVYKLLKKGFCAQEICNQLNISRATFYADKQQIERYFATQKEKMEARMNKFSKYRQAMEKQCPKISAFVLNMSFRTCVSVCAGDWDSTGYVAFLRALRSWGRLQFTALFREIRYRSLSLLCCQYY